MRTSMTNEPSTTKRRAGEILSIGIVVYTLIVAMICLRSVNTNPRTDDAEVFANFIGIAPQVDGPIVKLYVTVDQVDQATTLESTRRQAVEQARSQLKVSEAGLESALAQYEQSKAALDQSHQQVQVSKHSVPTLDPLVAQRSGRTSTIEVAEYNLNNCRIYAPFDARVTNLTISEGAYAHTGQQIFTLIDTR